MTEVGKNPKNEKRDAKKGTKHVQVHSAEEDEGLFVPHAPVLFFSPATRRSGCSCPRAFPVLVRTSTEVPQRRSMWRVRPRRYAVGAFSSGVQGGRRREGRTRSWTIYTTVPQATCKWGARKSSVGCVLSPIMALFFATLRRGEPFPCLVECHRLPSTRVSGSL